MRMVADFAVRVDREQVQVIAGTDLAKRQMTEEKLS